MDASGLSQQRKGKHPIYCANNRPTCKKVHMMKDTEECLDDARDREMLEGWDRDGYMRSYRHSRTLEER